MWPDRDVFLRIMKREKRMLRRNFGRLATMGLALSLALLAGAGDARADISLYLSYDGNPYQFVASSPTNVATFDGSFGGFSLVADTSITNFTGSPLAGFLTATTNQTLNVSGTHTLSLLSAVTDAPNGDLAFFQLPGTTDLTLTSTISGTSPSVSTGTATFQSFANATGNPLTPSGGISTSPTTVIYPFGAGSTSTANFQRLPEGYTLYNITTVSLTGVGATGNTSGSSTVTAAVPEASTVVMSSLMALMGTGYAWRKRKRATV
jgi:hypothetical protein